MDSHQPRQLRFGPFRLDPANASLWRGRRALRLPPKAFAVLSCLAGHPGQLVTKEALLEAVWPGTAVGDAVLKFCVREVRRVLGDRPAAPRFVATVHRRGYRFIAPVVPCDDHPPAHHMRPARPAGVSVTTSRPRRAGPAHLVGRASALDRLQAFLEIAWRGHRQIVFVTGEPGIGKTGVIEAFLEAIAGDPRVLIAQGQCVETHGTGEPYLAVLDALGHLCRDHAGDALTALLRRHAPTWLVQLPWLLDATDRETLARELLGATRERMLRELAHALEALTAEAPLVLVLEDLHWSDSATLALLGFLARRRESARLLVIGTYRPMAAVLPHHSCRDLRRELESEGLCHELSLELLGAAAVGEYLGQRFAASAFAPELARVIHRRTEGNPLFMVSVVDDLVARDAIVRREGRWTLRVALDEVELGVPESLRQMIERRLEQLALNEQHILAAASVAGMEFSAASVAAALLRPTIEVDAWCGELARRQLFIRFLGVREWPDGTATSRYGFLHALHRSALYQGISPARARAWHQAIGEREEAGHGDRVGDIAADLAAHFEHARDDGRTVRYLRQAAETAARRSANLEAVAYVTRALAIAERLSDAERVPARVTLLTQRGGARRAMGDMGGAVEDFAALADLARAQHLPAEEARALVQVGSALAWIDRDRSLAAAEQAHALAPALHDPALRAHIQGYCGFQRILFRGWRNEDAQACRAAIDAARGAGDRRLLSLHVGHYAHVLNHRSEYRAASRTAEEGLRLALEVGDASHYMTCQFHRAWALLHLGEWGETRRVLDDGLRMAEGNGHHLWARAFHFQMAWLLTELGDFATARTLCERERPPLEDVRLGQFLGSIVLGFAHLGLRQYGAARHAFEEVAARPETQAALLDWILQMPLRLGLGEYGLACRDFGRARKELEELCRLATAAGERTYLALGRRGLAEAALAEGDALTAERELADGVRALGSEAPLAEWRVWETAARTAQARGHAAKADASWARSAAVVDRLLASLASDADLHRVFSTHPVVRGIRRARRSRPDR